jgi:hypothetical protein
VGALHAPPHHQPRVTDQDLGVHAARRAGGTQQLLRAEGPLHEVDQLAGGPDGQIGEDSPDARPRGGGGGGHGSPPRKIRPEPRPERGSGQMAQVVGDFEQLAQLRLGRRLESPRVAQERLHRIMPSPVVPVAPVELRWP